MRCTHTGLDTRMCGHCNGSHPLEVEPFAGRRPEDEHPRLVKMRGKVEWRGKGESLGIRGSEAARALNVNTLPHRTCVRQQGFSEWARSNMLRSLAEGMK